MTDPADPKRFGLYLVAAERSGDLLGGGLIKALKQSPGYEFNFAGLGGPSMAEEGVESPFDISDLSIIGLVEGVKAYNRVIRRVKDTVADILDKRPDMVVLIDSWGFTLRVAQRVRKLAPEIKLVKYVGPQVWATRPGRARTLAAAVDHLMSIHSFDAPYFEKAGLPTTFVGNPTFERAVTGDGAAFRQRHGLDANDTVMLTLFGSRPSELSRMFESFAQTLSEMKALHPEVRHITILAGTIEHAARERLEQDERLAHLLVVDEDEKRDAFSASDLALACSGTVTTELAMAGVPHLAAYKLEPVTYFILDTFKVFKAPYVSMVNIAADEELIGEFLQSAAEPSELVPALSALVSDTERRADLSRRLIETTDGMRGAGQASERAARTVINLLNA